jgi:ABC-type bacteriocin/lantibiotic exporter with double-glycine peptidase domain
MSLLGKRTHMWNTCVVKKNHAKRSHVLLKKKHIKEIRILLMQKHVKKIQMLLNKKIHTKWHVEKETHKNNIMPKMSFYDWSLLIILVAYAIYN